MHEEVAAELLCHSGALNEAVTLHRVILALLSESEHQDHTCYKKSQMLAFVFIKRLYSSQFTSATPQAPVPPLARS